jgi:hypothetical protein
MRDCYPSLSKLALDVLSILASSCECERLFSELGDLLEPRRRRLGPQLLAAIQCVRRWQRAGLGGDDEVVEEEAADDDNIELLCGAGDLGRRNLTLRLALVQVIKPINQASIKLTISAC